MSANAIQTNTPKMPMRIVTKNAPMNAIPLFYYFYELIAIILITSKSLKKSPLQLKMNYYMHFSG